MNTSPKEIGDKITTLRKEAKMSQEDLANELNVSRQAVSNWERNKTQPDISTISEICGIFGVNVDELVRGEKNMVKQDITIQGEKYIESKYDIAIGLFYAIGLFLGMGCFFTIGLIFNRPMIWVASFIGGICLFLVVGLLAHAIITLMRKDK